MSARRWPLALALGTFALSGCADILGIGDPIISDGGTDSGKDVATDAPTDGHPDVATDAATDADGGCPSGLACEVCNVSGYTPPTMGKPTVVVGACSSNQLSDFATACVAPQATQTTCATWSTANQGSCVDCLMTMQSASAWGPVVCTSTGGCMFNIGGCLDLEIGQVTNEKNAGAGGSCGDLLDDVYGCETYACGTCGNGVFSSDFQTCFSPASLNECWSYVTTMRNASQCAVINAADASPPPGVNNCLVSFSSSYTAIASVLNVFCGTGP